MFRLLAPFFFIAIFGLFSSTFIVPEGRQAIVTQFGKPVREIKKAGLHWKIPMVQEVRRLDIRILSWDGDVEQMPTLDRKYIEVDTTARWKIEKPMLFIKNAATQNRARTRLDAILDSATRDIVGKYKLDEVVRNSNNVLKLIAKTKERQKKDKADGVFQENEEITGEIARIELGREQLSLKIAQRARKDLEALGIALVDVQIRRITYEKSVEQKVFERMISEQQRRAERIRSIGKGEKAKIEGKTSFELKEIQSKAYEQIQRIKGKAEAKAAAIYAKALRKDPKFYRFVRSLESYEKSLSKKTQILLSTESEFLKVLKNGR